MDGSGGMKFIYLCFIYSVAFFKILKLYLNRQERQKEIPESLKTIYVSYDYQKWKNYEDDTDKSAFVNIFVSTIISTILILSPIYAYLYQLLPSSILLNSLSMMIIMVTFEECIESIFNFYDTFVIEEKYHMNTSTYRIFFMDLIKSIVLDILLFAGLFVFVHYFMKWFSYWGMLVLFGVLTVIVRWVQKHPLFILRIFNHFIPLEDGALKEQLTSLVEKQGFELKGIYIMDASTRTKRANAFCCGEGKKKEICIDDNMFHQYSDEEIVAVFCHELGHAVYKHGEKMKWQTFIQGIMLFLLLMFIYFHPNLYQCFHIDQLNYYMICFVLSLVVNPLIIIMDALKNAYSRQYEFEADHFATMQGYGQALIRVLKKLAKDDLADIQPHPWVVKMTYSHPPFHLRLDAIERDIER